MQATAWKHRASHARMTHANGMAIEYPACVNGFAAMGSDCERHQISALRGMLNYLANSCDGQRNLLHENVFIGVMILHVDVYRLHPAFTVIAVR